MLVCFRLCDGKTAVHLPLHLQGARFSLTGYWPAPALTAIVQMNFAKESITAAAIVAKPTSTLCFRCLRIRSQAPWGKVHGGVSVTYEATGRMAYWLVVMLQQHMFFDSGAALW
jgi:hypothetical protein